MSTNKVGRPEIINDIVLSKLELGFSYGFTDEEACLFADISPSTFYRYIKENPKFGQRKEQLKRHPALKVKQNLMKFIDEGDKDITKFYAERKLKNEFSLKTEVDNNISGELTINKIIIEGI